MSISDGVVAVVADGVGAGTEAGTDGRAGASGIASG